MRYLGLFAMAGLILANGCSPPKGVYHTLEKGQTLYQVARIYEVDQDYLARINNISDPKKLSVGERIFIPGGTELRKVPATVVPASQATVSEVTRPKSKPTPQVRQPEKPLPTARKKTVSQLPPVAQKSSEISAPAVVEKHPKVQTSTGAPPAKQKGEFLWPVQGQVLRKFGSGTGNSVSNGIEIAVRKGHAVLSAAAGKVIYSGNGISGYGNLLILQHDDSFYTVYGYNQKNLVDAGTFVSRGEKIALSGVPPSGGIPRLYFEIRYGKKPLNPIFYLP